MANKQIVFAIVTFLHDLFTALWIGGLLTLVISVLPAVRAELDKDSARRVVKAIQKRLSFVVYASMAGLGVTGILLSNRSVNFTGFFDLSTPYAAALSLKHIVMLGMVAIALVRSLALERVASLAAQRTRWNRYLLLFNLVLGVLILLLTGFTAALSVPGGA